MPVLAAPASHAAGVSAGRLDELDDAREALEYWEARAADLPRVAVRGRREARELAVRWSDRVTEAERAAYGRGLRGALLLMGSELRMPEPARQAGRHAARRTKQAAVVVVATVLAVLAAMAIAIVVMCWALLGALT